MFSGCHIIICLSTSVLLSCGSGGESSIKKKRMPDLQYVYSSAQGGADIESSIAGTLDLYAADPRVFSDPIGIIDSFDDSTGFKPLGRRFGLIISDPNWFSSDSLLLKGTIEGGSVLSMIYNGNYSGLDSCWNEIYSFAKYNGHEYIMPGIEIYRGQDTDAATELIIRIK